MKRRLTALTVAATLTALALGGCGMLDDKTGNTADAAPGPATPAATTSTGTSSSGMGSVKDAGDIPDPCTLLSKDEVVELTARKITQMDEDGAETGATTRFCQWQQESGQLAVFLSRTTADDFKVVTADAQPVDGVGEDAFTLAGHLYVLYGTVQLDVYSRGASDEKNVKDASAVAKVLIPRV